MAEPKTVRGTLGGVTVQTTQENADRLGADFQPEKKATGSRSSSSSK